MQKIHDFTLVTFLTFILLKSTIVTNAEIKKKQNVDISICAKFLFLDEKLCYKLTKWENLITGK